MIQRDEEYEAPKNTIKAHGLRKRFVDRRAWKGVSNSWAIKCFNKETEHEINGTEPQISKSKEMS